MRDCPAYLSEAVKAQAAAWLARQHSNLRTEADEREFREWLNADPAHAVAFETLTAIWDAASAYPRDMRSSRHRLEMPALSRRAAMAGLTLAPAAATCFTLLRPLTATAQTYTTDVGGHERVELPDRGHAYLDTSTRIDLAYNPGARVVTLQYGRVNFAVVADKDRPFIVKAAQSRIFADASNFDVRRDDERVSVVLFSGQAFVHLDDQVKRLGPGERLELDHRKEVLDRPNLVTMEAWHSGRTVFENAKLSAAVAEMNRYSAVKIQIRGDHIADLRISGIYRNGDSVAFADTIAKLIPIKVVRTSTHVFLIENNDRPSMRL